MRGGKRRAGRRIEIVLCGAVFRRARGGATTPHTFSSGGKAAPSSSSPLHLLPHPSPPVAGRCCGSNTLVLAECSGCRRDGIAVVLSGEEREPLPSGSRETCRAKATSSSRSSTGKTGVCLFTTPSRSSSAPTAAAEMETTTACRGPRGVMTEPFPQRSLSSQSLHLLP